MIAAKGISDDIAFANFMSAMMADIMDGSIDPRKANAAVNAGGKLLKIVEMRYRYGRPGDEGHSLILAGN